MIMNIAKTLTALAATAITTVAFAAVTFDPASGMASSARVTCNSPSAGTTTSCKTTLLVLASNMRLRSTTTSPVWTTGESTRGDKTHRVTQNKSSSVNTLVAYDACSRNQVTGWNLTGFGIGTSTPVPVKGDACLGEGAVERLNPLSRQVFPWVAFTSRMALPAPCCSNFAARQERGDGNAAPLFCFCI